MKIPYTFIEEAIQSARRVVPKKDRKDILLNRLDQQTKDLEALKQQLDITEALIKEKTPAPVAAPTPALPETSPAVQEVQKVSVTAEKIAEQATSSDEKKPSDSSENEKLKAEKGEMTEKARDAEKKTPELSPLAKERLADRAAAEKEKVAEQEAVGRSLRDEIIRLQEQLEVAYSVYAQEQGLVLGDVTQIEKPSDVEGAKRYREFESVRAELLRLIDEEISMEAQEKAILEKRIQEAEKVLPTVTSKAMNQDIVKEKERMLQRVTDLETRRDFLSKEKERFSAKS